MPEIPRPKERKLYAIIDAFSRTAAHLNVTDARYISTVKLFISGLAFGIGIERAAVKVRY